MKMFIKVTWLFGEKMIFKGSVEIGMFLFGSVSIERRSVEVMIMGTRVVENRLL